MNKWERFVGALGGLIAIGGCVLGLFGVRTFGMLEPFATFAAGSALLLGGFMVGWHARAWREDRSTGRLRRRYDALDGGRRQLLEDMYSYGFIEKYHEDEDSRLCDGMSRMGLTELASGGVTCKWALTEKCRRMMDGMRGI